MEEFNFEEILDNMDVSYSEKKELKSRYTRGVAKWYYDETSYEADLDLTNIFYDEA